MHHKAIWPIAKFRNRGFRGYPVVTVAFYGPDDRRASKVAVGILPNERADPDILQRWNVDEGDVRDSSQIASDILGLIQEHGAKTVAMADHIIGCPHEEGVDYPLGEDCPACPFWAGRDRWSGEKPSSAE